MRDALVKTWMSSPVVTVTAKARVPDALAIMQEHAVSRLPVLNDAGTLVGIVTRVDLNEARPPGYLTMQSWASIAYALHLMTVAEVMTPDPFVIGPDEDLCEAAHQMLTHRISGLPVVEHGRVIGMLTDSDVFRKFAADCGRAPVRRTARRGKAAA